MKKTFRNILLIALCLVVGTSSYAQTKNAELEIIDNNLYRKILKDVRLTPTEEAIYPKIFEAIRKEDWKLYNRLMNEVNSDAIKGHLLAGKYLSKTYRTSYKELQEWLESYPEYPQYNQLYKIAKKRSKNTNLSKSLAYSSVIDTTQVGSGYDWYRSDYKSLPRNYRDYVKKNVRLFRRYINSGKSLMAKRILEDKQFIKAIPKKNYDEMCANLATVYFVDDQDNLAFEWGSKATRSKISQGYWFAGLASWRLGNFETAAQLFDELSMLETSDEWMRSAGGYWGYRAYIKSQNVVKAQEMLENAAMHKRTFYGILANYQLRIVPNYNWDFYSYINDFSSNEYENIVLNSDVLKRAIIVAKLGQKDLFLKEIKFGYRNFDDKQKEIAMFVAKQYGIYNIALQISNDLASKNEDVFYDYIAYPLPKWDSKIWIVDKGLTLSFIRQESVFVDKAVSHVGARGLMQVMPNTAYHVTGDKNIKRDKKTLLEREYNLEVGQKYIKYLLEKSYINGNLFYLAVAYNAGPGNLSKWQRSIKYNGDPFMFIEAIPSRQTRVYVKRIMANYWLYSYQLGNEALSIEQLANGLEPTIK